MSAALWEAPVAGFLVSSMLSLPVAGIPGVSRAPLSTRMNAFSSPFRAAMASSEAGTPPSQRRSSSLTADHLGDEEEPVAPGRSVASDQLTVNGLHWYILTHVCRRDRGECHA